MWKETIRAVEEFNNLPLFGLDDEVIEAALVALSVNAAISRPRRLRALRGGEVRPERALRQRDAKIDEQVIAEVSS